MQWTFKTSKHAKVVTDEGEGLGPPKSKLCYISTDLLIDMGLTIQTIRSDDSHRNHGPVYT